MSKHEETSGMTDRELADYLRKAASFKHSEDGAILVAVARLLDRYAWPHTIPTRTKDLIENDEASRARIEDWGRRVRR